MADEHRAPTAEESAADFYARKRSKNYAIFGAIIGLAVLFFVITIVRMS